MSWKAASLMEDLLPVTEPWKSCMQCFHQTAQAYALQGPLVQSSKQCRCHFTWLRTLYTSVAVLFCCLLLWLCPARAHSFFAFRGPACAHLCFDWTSFLHIVPRSGLIVETNLVVGGFELNPGSLD